MMHYDSEILSILRHSQHLDEGKEEDEQRKAEGTVCWVQNLHPGAAFPSSHNLHELSYGLHTHTGHSAVDKRSQYCLRPVRFRKQQLKVQTGMVLIKGQRLGQD